MEEVWKQVKGFEGLFEVSNFGRVKRLPYTLIGNTKGFKKSYVRYFKGGVLKGTVCKNGYCRVTLAKNGETHYCHVHRLVAEAFIPNPENLPFVNHIDEVRTNNRVDNLEWCSCQYNNTYKDARKRFAEAYSRNHSYPIKMLTLSGKLVQTFPSIKEAAKAVGVTANTVYRAIVKERKTAAGHIWEKE